MCSIVSMDRPDICAFFGEIEDPRVERTRRHDLVEVIVMAVLAVICNADGWPDIRQFCAVREEWLRTFLGLRSGVPSPSTFRRIFTALDVDAFNAAFMKWTQSLVGSLAGKLVAIDGKTLRGSYSSRAAQDPLHIVSAWVGENQIVFGQVATEEKSNEITAIPRLLEMLDVRGATITIDAMGCQRRIVDTIVEGGGDYVIAVKDNQPSLRAEIEAAFATCEIAAEQLPPSADFESVDRAHGRVERRTVRALDVVDRLSERQDWTALKSVVLVRSERTVRGVTSSEDRYYISSLRPDAATLAGAIRGHWGIENQQHWTLDMTFNEDRSRSRKANAPDNFALLRRIALNLLKTEKTKKLSLAGKRKLAGWDTAYLMTVLQATAASTPPTT
jgi:predicted transposase YbfD/YdcC